jgi:hypothetical protein
MSVQTTAHYTYKEEATKSSYFCFDGKLWRTVLNTSYKVLQHVTVLFNKHVVWCQMSSVNILNTKNTLTLRMQWFNSISSCFLTCEGVSKSFWTDWLPGARTANGTALCSCIAILWVSLVSFAAITLCVASRVFIVVYFVVDSVRKLLDTSPCKSQNLNS